MGIGKVELGEVKEILRKNKRSMLDSNVIGSDFSFLKRKATNLIFKIEPMVFYKFLSTTDNARLSAIFPLNDFVTSGTMPSIAMIDFEKTSESGKEFYGYVDSVFKFLNERKIKVASGHTGNYGNLGYGVAGTMALVGFKKPIFNYQRIEKEDSFYLVGKLGAELSYFRDTYRGKRSRYVAELSIEGYVAEFVKRSKTVHYLHDLSEGGLLRALREVSELVGCGFNVESKKMEAVAVKEVKEYGARIFSASSSGSVIASVDSKRKKEFENTMNEKSWPFFEIEKKKKGITLDNKIFSGEDIIAEVLV